MTERAELLCEQIVEIVTDYLDGAMEPSDRARVEEHLDGCPHCAVYLQQMRRTIRAIGRVHSGDLAPEARSELMHAFRSWQQADPRDDPSP